MMRDYNFGDRKSCKMNVTNSEGTFQVFGEVVVNFNFQSNCAYNLSNATLSVRRMI